MDLDLRPVTAGGDGAKLPPMSNRYQATIAVRVNYDADDVDDARRVAERLADSVSIATPLGRGAELIESSTRVRAA